MNDSTLVRFGSLVGLSLAGLLLAGLFLVSPMASSQSHSPDLQAQAMAFLEAAPDQIDIAPGQVLYLRKENYDRHGPKAEEITQVRNLTTEKSVRETWYEVGPNRQVVRSASRLIDANGTVVQVDLGQDGSLKAIDPRTNVVLKELPFLEVPIDGMFGHANIVHAWLANGTATATEVSDSQVAVESESSLPQGEVKAGTFQVPFFLDLGADTGLSRYIISDAGLEVGAELYGLTDGDQVLISSMRMTDVQIVAAIPTDVLDVQTVPNQAEGNFEQASQTYCTNPWPRECTDWQAAHLGGTDLEAATHTYLARIGPEVYQGSNGYYLYWGIGYSWSYWPIQYIAILGAGGHDCSHQIYLWTWYSERNHHWHDYANLDNTYETIAQHNSSLCIPWRNWTSGNHTMTHSNFGWWPNTEAVVQCTTQWCSW